MKIAITGHRPNKLGNDYDLTSSLTARIKAGILVQLSIICSEKHVQMKDLTFITGMALGIDTLFAIMAINYKIPFIAAIPCSDHSSKWIDKSVKIYKEILENPLCTVKMVYNGSYNHSCMQERNIWMCDNCDLLIAVFDGTPGGTANCVKYAKSIGRDIIEINPKLI